ncbi:MAG: hypothetical protein R3182_13415 [Draconibacterium sp.]|nr:hypothetical protein [Draconibacterium sp.]
MFMDEQHLASPGQPKQVPRHKNPNLLVGVFSLNVEKLMLIRKPIEIAEIFRVQRKIKGISQAKIAKSLATRQEKISKFENKPETVRLQDLMDLMSALGLELYIAPKPEKPARRRWEGDW